MEKTTQFSQIVYFNDISEKKNLIELLSFQEGKEVKRGIETNEIIFMLKGNCKVECDVYQEFTLEEGDSVFFPAACNYSIKYNNSIDLLSIRLDLFQRLAGCYSIEELSEEFPNYNFTNGEARIFKKQAMIQAYLESVCSYIKDKLATPVLFDMKIKELLYLLNHYHSKEELAAFFSPILNKEVNFASSILANWHSVKSIKELIQLSGYCKATFNKKFKSVFGCTPYKWLNDRRAAQIYYDLSNTSKPFKKIAEEHGFNSQQHLNDYCVRYFKNTPGCLRLSNCKQI